MSLREQLEHAKPPAAQRRGPAPECEPLYATLPPEDCEAILAYKGRGYTWQQVHDTVDDLLGVQQRIKLDKFIRHWRRRCSCWDRQR